MHDSRAEFGLAQRKDFLFQCPLPEVKACQPAPVLPLVKTTA